MVKYGHEGKPIAKQAGGAYKTDWRWFKAGELDAYPSATGTIIVRDKADEKPLTGRVALYAQVSSAGQKEDLERQWHRLKDDAAAKGYQVAKEVVEIASGLNEHRPKLEMLLTDRSMGTIIVENRDRLTRFGSHSIETLLERQGRKIEMLFLGDTGDELVDDFVAVIMSMAARIYGRRSNKNQVRHMHSCIEQVMHESESQEGK